MQICWSFSCSLVYSWTLSWRSFVLKAVKAENKRCRWSDLLFPLLPGRPHDQPEHSLRRGREVPGHPQDVGRGRWARLEENIRKMMTDVCFLWLRGRHTLSQTSCSVTQAAPLDHRSEDHACFLQHITSCSMVWTWTGASSTFLSFLQTSPSPIMCCQTKMEGLWGTRESWNNSPFYLFLLLLYLCLVNKLHWEAIQCKTCIQLHFIRAGREYVWASHESVQTLCLHIKCVVNLIRSL